MAEVVEESCSPGQWPESECLPLTPAHASARTRPRFLGAPGAKSASTVYALSSRTIPINWSRMTRGRVSPANAANTRLATAASKKSIGCVCISKAPASTKQKRRTEMKTDLANDLGTIASGVDRVRKSIPIPLFLLTKTSVPMSLRPSQTISVRSRFKASTVLRFCATALRTHRSLAWRFPNKFTC